MTENILGIRNAPRSTSIPLTEIWEWLRQRVKPARVFLTLFGVGLLCAVPGAALAQNCGLHDSEAFQFIGIQNFGGHSPDAIRHQIAPPKTLPRLLSKDDDAIPITVPRIPLPVWAVILLYEIRDHATRQDIAAIIAKTTVILDWVARTSPEQQPSPPPIGNPSDPR